MIPPRPPRRAQSDLPPTGGPVGLRPRSARLVAPRARVGARAPAVSARGISGAFLFVISNMAYVACAMVLGAHVLFASDEHPFAVRVLTAVPAILLILEARHFLEKEAGELPFVVFALLQYYAVFGFGVFFDLEFFDVQGPVRFTSDARLFGAAAVALGAVCISVAARLGRGLGREIEPWAVKTMPPAQLPARWDSALYLYAFATVAVGLAVTLFPQRVPTSLGQPISYAFAAELAMGFAIVAPARRGRSLLPQVLVGTTAALGLLRGSLAPVFRAGVSFTAGRWATVRAVSWRVAVAVVAVCVMLQPVKGLYRQQVWTGKQVGVSERVDAWRSALSVDEQDDTGEVAMSRLSEFHAVMHAFLVLPGRVQSLDGSGLLPAVYAPIPRFLWKDKPTTRDTVQRYGVTFGRQTEAGARTTAFNLPLLVEGYWNFGWPGIALVTAALGLWLGLSQKLFASSHWAMRATGIANLTNLTVAGPVVYVYGSIFQTITSRIAVCWALFWLAKILSPEAHQRPQLTSRRALRS